MKHKGGGWYRSLLGCALLWGSWAGRAQVASAPAVPIVWEEDTGDGFHRGVNTASIEAGATHGLAAFGSRQAHDFGVLSLSYGWMLGGPKGGDRWPRGNLELRLELFGATQYLPRQDWLAGLTPHLRYNFTTRTRLVPFVDLGAGVALTGIREPDLSSLFQFNELAGAGMHWLAKQNLALTFEARYLHVSNAGISHPNLGVNGVMGMVGVTRFF